MKKFSLILVIVVILIASMFFLFSNKKNTSKKINYTTKTIAKNLDTVWGMAFLPDGDLIFTERKGNIKIIENKTVRKLLDINKVSERGESGLLGIDIDPEFSKNNFVYLYYTAPKGNRVSRFTLNKSLKDEQVLIDNIPSAIIHDGGRIKFGPDNKLYITVGDSSNPSLAQDKNSLAGKILRINKNGSIPKDNPFGNEIFSYGHRNPQGID